MAFQLICGNFTLLFSEEYLSSAKGNDTVGTWLSLVEHSVRDAGELKGVRKNTNSLFFLV